LVSFDTTKTPFIAQLPFHRVTHLAELDQQLRQARELGKPAMLDFYADWCTACIVMARDVFADPRIQTALHAFYLIQVDLTDTPDAETLLNRFHVLGPPSILFFDAQGKLLKSVSVIGEMKADAFYQHLLNRVMPHLHSATR
jgi:thiol:disulfide interchange protein DsbD